MLCGAHLLRAGRRKQSGPLQRLGQGQLACADFVALGFVEPQRQKFEVGDDMVQFDADGAWDDVVHAQLLAGVRPQTNGCSISFAQFRQTLRVKAAEFFGDVEITQQGITRELGGEGVGVTSPPDGFRREGHRPGGFIAGGGEPVHTFLDARIGAPRTERGQFPRIDEFGDDARRVRRRRGDREEARPERKEGQQEQVQPAPAGENGGGQAQEAGRLLTKASTMPLPRPTVARSSRRFQVKPTKSGNWRRWAILKLFMCLIGQQAQYHTTKR